MTGSVGNCTISTVVTTPVATGGVGNHTVSTALANVGTNISGSARSLASSKIASGINTIVMPIFIGLSI